MLKPGLAPDLINTEDDVVGDAAADDRALTTFTVKGERHRQQSLQRVTLLPTARADVGLPR